MFISPYYNYNNRIINIIILDTKHHDLLKNVGENRLRVIPSNLKESLATHALLFTVARYPLEPIERRRVRRKSSFIPVRGFTLPHFPLDIGSGIRGTLLARGMRLFTRLLSSLHRVLVEFAARVLNQFDRHGINISEERIVGQLTPSWNRKQASKILEERSQGENDLLFTCLLSISRRTWIARCSCRDSLVSREILMKLKINPSSHCRVYETCQFNSALILGRGNFLPTK